MLFNLPSVQFSSIAQSCPTLCDPMNHSAPGLPVHHQLPEFTQTHAYWVGDANQPSQPLSSPSSPALNLSQHQGADESNESALCIRWPKYWSFSFNISPSNEYPGLISFRMDWLDLPAVQWTLKSLLQNYSSKASKKSIFIYLLTFGCAGLLLLPAGFLYLLWAGQGMVRSGWQLFCYGLLIVAASLVAEHRL